VRDDEGNPVEGAALDIGGQLVFTNSGGEFFLRIGRPSSAPLAVLTAEFLLPGQWELVSAPAQVQAGPENGAKAVEIILRRSAAPAK
jgi:hypothetical protein